MLDSLLEDPLPLLGGVGLLAALGGLYAFSKRRGRKAGAEAATALPVPSSLGPNSVFRMTGGQSVDTGNVPPLTGEFSQTGPGTIDTDEVDPVAEADVYMAYGRDTQAEEILLEALQKDPHRTAIHTKLLEIYANRHSVKQFETLAGELYAQAGGVGPDWEKAAALGVSLDPANPLYSRGQPASVSAPVQAPIAAAAAPVADFLASAEPVHEPVAESKPSFSADSFELPDEVPAKASAEDVAPPAEVLPVEEPVAEAAPMALDFNLVDEPTPEPEPVAVETLQSEPAVDTDNALDFDLSPQVEEVEATEPSDSALDDAAHDFSPEGTLVVPPAEERQAIDVVASEEPFDIGAKAQANLDSVDFDFEMSSPATETIVNPISELINEGDILGDGGRSADFGSKLPPKPLTEDDLDFDVKLTDSIVLGQPMPSPEFDIGTINLDLSQPPAEMSATDVAGESGGPASSARDERWEETNTKLDLAKAYEEMGDLEGARELLEEVAGEGIDDLAQQARTMLERISG
jgi:pilus assembly protein FimV